MVDMYGTIPDATTYHADRGNDAWSAAGVTDAQRTAALVRASGALDGQYGSRFPGHKTGGRAQALAWPRAGARDACADEDIPDDEIPVQVENAAYELALAELVRPGSSSPTVTPGRVVKRQKVEGIEREFFSASEGAAIRTAFSEGLAQGQNPRVSALNVVGRVSRVSNRREGGVIGLTAQQERFVARARQELSSGDPEELRKLLSRGRRDKRFDKSILKLIREERQPDADFIAKWTGRYADKLLALRGEMIGQNETATALDKSRAEAVRQQIASGKLAQQDVRKVWKHTPQEHPRLHHVAMNGKSVAWGEKFELPNGVRMDHPHSDDAPADETIFCKCFWSAKIDYFASVERRFKAEAV